MALATGQDHQDQHQGGTRYKAPTSSEEKEEGEVEEDDGEHTEYKHTVLAHGGDTGCLNIKRC